MAKEPKEVTPVCISLGNIVKFYRTKKQPLGDVSIADKELLGEEAWNDFYLTANTNQRDASYYKRDQGYTGAERIFSTYFDQIGSKYDKRKDLKKTIYSAWLKRVKESLPQYEEKIQDFLEDGVLRNSEEESVVKFRNYLNKFARATKPKERAELLTALTLLSITRKFWGKIKPEDILPENPDRDPDVEIQIDDFKAAKELISKKKYNEAIKLLRPLIKYKAEEGTVERIEQLKNGYINYLISKAYRGLRKVAGQDSVAFQQYTDDLRDSLNEAKDCHYIPAMLEIARDYFSVREDSVYDVDIPACMELCREIISDNAKFEAGGETFGKECGEAFWMMYFHEKDDKKAEEYLQKSAFYSYHKAVAEWTEKHEVSLVQSLKKSTDTTTGCYYINADNIYSSIIKKTSAKGWTRCDYPLNQESFSSESDAPIIDLKGLQKYFLVSDNFDKNLGELLQLLQVVKNNVSKLNDKQIEFYIRGIEDEIYPFIDTALARISICVPVHILDDNKLSARVLAKHPLFYPIRKLRSKKSSSLNLVVIGNTPCCEWIVREAFWMMTFRNKNIQAKITLISPDPDDFEKKLKFKCQDLDKGKSVGNLLEIEKIQCELNNVDLITYLKPYAASEKTYMVVDTGTDTFNASLAIKIKETIIREYIENSDDELNKEFPIVAFRCTDPDISNLTRRSIVLNEVHGYKWFNNYTLIPFGSADQNYTWNELTDNLFERLGLNVHLQYYKNPVLLDPTSPDYDKEFRGAEKAFWDRSYNRDSSIAVAMSIPYRLYQCSLTDTESPILPIGPDPLENKPLSILDGSSFMSIDAFDAYAIKFREAGRRAAEKSHEARINVSNEATKSEASRNSYELCMKKAGEVLEESRCGWHNAKYQQPFCAPVSGYHESVKKGIFTKGNYLYQYIMEDDTESELYQLAEWEHNRWIRFMISRGWTLAKIKSMKLYHSEENKRQQLYIGKMHPCMVPYEAIHEVDKAWSSLIDKPYSFKENDIFAIQMTEQILNMEWTKIRENYLNPNEIERQ